MAILDFDHIDSLGSVRESDPARLPAKTRSVPYSKYFGEMELDRQSKEQRISLARRIELAMLFLFAYIETLGDRAGDFRESAVEILEERYAQAVSGFVSPDDYTDKYIHNRATEIVDVTIRHLNTERTSGDPIPAADRASPTEGHLDSNRAANYYLSDDRAMLISENESNSIMNYGDFRAALRNGKTKKQWSTMKDKKVRETHAELQGKTIGIQEYFTVGNSLMLFPRDISMGASSDEIAGCRCSLKYF